MLFQIRVPPPSVIENGTPAAAGVAGTGSPFKSSVPGGTPAEAVVTDTVATLPLVKINAGFIYLVAAIAIRLFVDFAKQSRTKLLPVLTVKL